jgi:hypothetical protein
MQIVFPIYFGKIDLKCIIDNSDKCIAIYKVMGIRAVDIDCFSSDSNCFLKTAGQSRSGGKAQSSWT